MVLLRFLYIIYFLFFNFSLAHAFNTKIELKGLSKELEKNIYAHLSVINKKIFSNNIPRYIISKTIKNTLKIFGYYNPVIEFKEKFKKNKSKENQNSHLIVNIKSGKPIKIISTNILLEGEAKNDREYQTWIKQKTPKIGNKINHIQYDTFKKGLVNLSLKRGYFDGFFKKSQLGIIPKLYKGFWNIHYDSGKRYHISEIKFHGSQIRNDYLYKIIPFKKNSYYSSYKIAELNKRFSSTGWFRSVIINPNFHEKNINYKTIPLNIIFLPYKKNFIKIGISYVPNLEFNTKIIWKKPWINERGHNFLFYANFSNQKHKINFSYKIPLLKNPLKDYYKFSGKNEEIKLNNKISTINTILSASRYWNSNPNWQQSIKMHWSLSNFIKNNNLKKNILLIYPKFTIIHHSNIVNKSTASWWNAQRYSINIANTHLGSDINFLIIQIKNTWIYTLNKKHRFITRNHFGVIKSNNLNKLPINLRFFAGGSKNIRGYEYKKISPSDKHGNLIGARNLLTTSLEYQYNFKKKIWGGIFFDIGEAVNDIKKSNFKIGVGFSIQWKSPIGNIKCYIAKALHDQNEHGFQVYMDFGSEA